MDHIDFEKAAHEILNFSAEPDFGWHNRNRTASDLADLWVEMQYAKENPPTWSDARVQEIYRTLCQELVRLGLPQV